MRPQRVPIGLQLGRAARVVSRAFDQALEEAGGTLPVWLILLNLKLHRPGNQRELAEAVGVREATLTHHLNGMDTRGLITRRRDTVNRRIHVVELTDEGQALFERLQQAAVAFDARLRHGLTDADADALGALLARLTANVGDADEGAMPWAGFAEKRLSSRPALTTRLHETRSDHGSFGLAKALGGPFHHLDGPFTLTRE